jgi:hypothetical protein
MLDHDIDNCGVGDQCRGGILFSDVAIQWPEDAINNYVPSSSNDGKLIMS